MGGNSSRQQQYVAKPPRVPQRTGAVIATLTYDPDTDGHIPGKGWCSCIVQTITSVVVQRVYAEGPGKLVAVYSCFIVGVVGLGQWCSCLVAVPFH
mgnify:CR=1 FL=1